MISCGLDLAVESHALRHERYGIFYPDPDSWILAAQKEKKKLFASIIHSIQTWIQFMSILSIRLLLVAAKGLVVNTFLPS